ncbi:hypothetical protein [uncultured phage MedDCM-OCT-S05-C113]|nr:hypothetical protein [uncultured phage MedDCM-OCT-S05-C113]
MHQIKLRDQKKLADCLTHSTDDPLTVIRFIDKFKELFPAIQMPFYYLEVEANAKLDAEATIFYAEEERRAEEAESRMIMESKDRRVA